MHSYRIGFTKLNMFFLSVIFLFVSCATYATIGQYTHFYKITSEDEYRELYYKYAEETVYGELRNEDMMVPVLDKKERTEIALSYLDNYLFNMAVEKDVIEQLKKEISSDKIKSPEMIDKIITEYTGMSGIYNFLYEESYIKMGSYEEYRTYVSSNLLNNSHSALIYKYVEFFMLYVAFAMFFYGSVRYRKYCDQNYTDTLTYRNQMSLRNIFFIELFPVMVFCFCTILVNIIFYLSLVGINAKDFIDSFSCPFAILIQVFFINSLFLSINYLTKKWFVADLLLFSLLFYSNYYTNINGHPTWKVKPFSILIRYQQPFFENIQHSNVIINNLLLLFCSIIVLYMFSLLLKKRKRR